MEDIMLRWISMGFNAKEKVVERSRNQICLENEAVF